LKTNHLANLKVDDQTQYFFVFQNKGYKDESLRGYLWAPQKDKRGRELSHWKLLSAVKKGDVIIHSHKQKIVAISVASKDCHELDRPLEKGEGWSKAGWRVDSDYMKISVPLKLTSKIREDFLKLAPSKNSPFDKNGSGNSGYFFAANRPMLEYILNEILLQDVSSKKVAVVLDQLRLFKAIDLKKEDRIDQDLKENIDEHLSSVSEHENYVPVPQVIPKQIQSNGGLNYLRDKSNSARALKRANFKCEIDPTHTTFLRKSGICEYTEPHHLIPMSKQNSFRYSLDVEANIVSLCSNCHNHIHYGLGSERLIVQLYNARIKELFDAGITLTLDDLKKIYGIK
jgi:5-methylcytosine-specific restriction endonuclease McrA